MGSQRKSCRGFQHLQRARRICVWPFCRKRGVWTSVPVPASEAAQRKSETAFAEYAVRQSAAPAGSGTCPSALFSAFRRAYARRHDAARSGACILERFRLHAPTQWTPHGIWKRTGLLTNFLCSYCNRLRENHARKFRPFLRNFSKRMQSGIICAIMMKK